MRVKSLFSGLCFSASRNWIKFSAVNLLGDLFFMAVGYVGIEKTISAFGSCCLNVVSSGEECGWLCCLLIKMPGEELFSCDLLLASL